MIALRIDEALWDSASSTRRAEWRTLLAELAMRGPVFEDAAIEEACFGFDGEHFYVRLVRAPAPESIALPRTGLVALLNEYVEVIQRLDDDGLPMARLEALDMAKKVVHDEGAKAVGQLVPPLSSEHETRRRLFTLLVALYVDTTKHPSAHRHGKA